MPKTQREHIILASCEEPSEDDWIHTVKNCFSNAGMLNVFLNEVPSRQTPSNKLFHREKDIFQQTALHSTQNMSKLRTFNFIKQTWKLEEYLFTVQNVSDRTALTKFRLSNHRLMIEKGRYQNTSPSDRVCPFCPGQIENEFHFLIKCPTYKSLRKNLLNNVETLTSGFFYPSDEEFLLWFLLNNPMISHLTAKFIRLSMELRALLLENPRNNT